MELRTARDGDVTAIAARSRERALHVADPDPGLDYREWLELGFGEDRWLDCLVAEIDSEVVGYAFYRKRYEAHTRSRTLWLGDLVAAKQYRGRGKRSPHWRAGPRSMCMKPERPLLLSSADFTGGSVLRGQANVEML